MKKINQSCILLKYCPCLVALALVCPGLSVVAMNNHSKSQDGEINERIEFDKSNINNGTINLQLEELQIEKNLSDCENSFMEDDKKNNELEKEIKDNEERQENDTLTLKRESIREEKEYGEDSDRRKKNNVQDENNNVEDLKAEMNDDKVFKLKEQENNSENVKGSEFGEIKKIEGDENNDENIVLNEAKNESFDEEKKSRKTINEGTEKIDDKIERNEIIDNDEDENLNIESPEAMVYAIKNALNNVNKDMCKSMSNVPYFLCGNADMMESNELFQSVAEYIERNRSCNINSDNKIMKLTAYGANPRFYKIGLKSTNLYWDLVDDKYKPKPGERCLVNDFRAIAGMTTDALSLYYFMCQKWGCSIIEKFGRQPLNDNKNDEFLPVILKSVEKDIEGYFREYLKEPENPSYKMGLLCFLKIGSNVFGFDFYGKYITNEDVENEKYSDIRDWLKWSNEHGKGHAKWCETLLKSCNIEGITKEFKGRIVKSIEKSEEENSCLGSNDLAELQNTKVCSKFDEWADQMSGIIPIAGMMWLCKAKESTNVPTLQTTLGIYLNLLFGDVDNKQASDFERSYEEARTKKLYSPLWGGFFMGGFSRNECSWLEFMSNCRIMTDDLRQKNEKVNNEINMIDENDSKWKNIKLENLSIEKIEEISEEIGDDVTANDTLKNELADVLSGGEWLRSIMVSMFNSILNTVPFRKAVVCEKNIVDGKGRYFIESEISNGTSELVVVIDAPEKDVDLSACKKGYVGNKACADETNKTNLFVSQIPVMVRNSKAHGEFGNRTGRLLLLTNYGDKFDVEEVYQCECKDNSYFLKTDIGVNDLIEDNNRLKIISDKVVALWDEEFYKKTNDEAKITTVLNKSYDGSDKWAENILEYVHAMNDKNEENVDEYKGFLIVRTTLQDVPTVASIIGGMDGVYRKNIRLKEEKRELEEENEKLNQKKTEYERKIKEYESEKRKNEHNEKVIKKRFGINRYLVSEDEEIGDSDVLNMTMDTSAYRGGETWINKKNAARNKFKEEQKEYSKIKNLESKLKETEKQLKILQTNSLSYDSVYAPLDKNEHFAALTFRKIETGAFNSYIKGLEEGIKDKSRCGVKGHKEYLYFGDGNRQPGGGEQALYERICAEVFKKAKDVCGDKAAKEACKMMGLEVGYADTIGGKKVKSYRVDIYEARDNESFSEFLERWEDNEKVNNDYVRCFRIKERTLPSY